MEARRDFPSEPAAVPDARRWAADVASAWGVIGSTLDIVAFDVTELASNAVRHARSPFRICLTLDGDSFRIEVIDASDEPPRVLRAAPEATAGRGLALVRALSHRAGVDQVPSGKRVWAEVRI